MAEETISLFTLMNNHFSSLNVNENSSDNVDLQNPATSGSPKRSDSDHLSPFVMPKTINIPNLMPENNAIKQLLSIQISNMLKAKEQQKQEEEERKLADEMRQLKLKEEQEYVIDLSQAIIRNHYVNEETKEVVEEKLEVIVPKFVINRPLRLTLRFNKELYDFSKWQLNLPCCTDMTFMLKKKVKRARPSPLGKVLCSRPRRVYAPYELEKPQTAIVPFDFSTKSPCDEYLENLRKPRMHNPFTVNILDWI